MTLVALTREKDVILDGLIKTGAVQICSQEDYELACEKGFESASKDRAEEELRAREALSAVEEAVDSLPKEEREKFPVFRGLFGVTADEFLATGDRLGEIAEKIDGIIGLSEKRAGLKAELSKLSEERKGYAEYENLKEKFSDFSDTKYVKTVLGVVPNDKSDKLFSAFGNSETVVFGKAADGTKGAVVFAAYLKKDAENAERILNENGFKKCPYKSERTAADEIKAIDEEIKLVEEKALSLVRETAENAVYVRDIRLYIDYLGFLKEKAKDGEEFRRTAETFVMKAFVPTEATARVEENVAENATAYFTEFSPVKRTEFAPTLMKNNKVVSNFEAVTNMYSAPAYGAKDPNAVMSFFFSLFMGLIMGDAGYGLLMIVGGLLLAKKSREGTTMRRFGKIFAYGGIFAVLFGILFDSFLGFNIIRRFAGEDYNAFYAAHIDPINAISSIAGIDVPSILLWCLALGTFQIAVSLVMKAVQCFERKQIAEGIFGGLVWAFALVSAIILVFGIVRNVGALTTYALYSTIALFALGIITSGISEKGFKKATKTFGSLYGLINYMSDILSYARLYGLMLSGAQIASIFTNTLAVGMLFPQGFIGIVFGVLIIIVGNLFNLAMSLLGAYIHDSRLQYVEFFGRFYEGEGELFTPLGSEREFVYFK